MNQYCESGTSDNCYCYASSYSNSECSFHSNNLSYTAQDYSNDLTLQSYYRPRGYLARSLYHKYLADIRLQEYDRTKWYYCDVENMPQCVREKHVPLGVDEETDHFLSEAVKKSDYIVMQLWYSIAKSILGWFMTQTSINGLLGRGSMFVFSLSHFRLLLSVEDSWNGTNLLDLGAGDGRTTEVMAPLFQNTFVTEISGPMKWILTKRGYVLLEPESWQEEGLRFDVISCLNLLDRCDTPKSLLMNIRRSLTKDGRAVVALVLPYKPYVEMGRSDHNPSEWLPITGDSFEEQVCSAIKHVFEPHGFRVDKWSRVPYLCEGDLNQSFYWLDDAVFVLSPLPDESNT